MEIVLIIIIRRTQPLSSKCWETLLLAPGGWSAHPLWAAFPQLPGTLQLCFLKSYRFWLIFFDGKWSRKYLSPTPASVATVERGHPAPAPAVWGGGDPVAAPAHGSARTLGPGPGQGGQLLGAARSLCPRVWGRAEGPRVERRHQVLRGSRRQGGVVLQLTLVRGQPHGSGARGVRGAAGQAGRARRCPTAAPRRWGPPATGAGETHRGEELLTPPPLDTLSQEWVAGGMLGSIQCEGNYPPPSPLP